MHRIGLSFCSLKKKKKDKVTWTCCCINFLNLTLKAKPRMWLFVSKVLKVQLPSLSHPINLYLSVLFSKTALEITVCIFNLSQAKYLELIVSYSTQNVRTLQACLLCYYCHIYYIISITLQACLLCYYCHIYYIYISYMPQMLH